MRDPACSVWVVEHNVVEGIQKVSGEKKSNPFRHQGALGQGEVESKGNRAERRAPIDRLC